MICQISNLNYSHWANFITNFKDSITEIKEKQLPELQSSLMNFKIVLQLFQTVNVNFNQSQPLMVLAR